MKNRNLDHKDNWRTPPEFYEKKNKIYHFDFDPCPYNHDVNEWDGLEVEWGSVNFVNPPYSLKLKSMFVEKAVEEMKKGKASVLLLPVSTSTKLFHEVIKPNARHIEFIKGRLPFIGVNDKGQLVNHHLIEEVTDKTIHHINRSGVFEIGKDIPKYVKNSGQHDSMIVEMF